MLAVGVVIKTSCCFADNGEEMHQSSFKKCNTIKSFGVHKYCNTSVALYPRIKLLHIPDLNSYPGIKWRDLEMKVKKKENVLSSA